MQHTPLEALPITGRRAERAWGPLVASVAAHAAAVLLVLLLIHRRPETPKSDDQPEPATATETVVLAPPLRPKPLPQLRPKPEPILRAPEPRPERPIPRPQVTRAPENIPEDPPTPTPEPPTVTPVPPVASASPGPVSPVPSTSSAPTEVASADAAFAAETERLFGRRNSTAPGGGMPQPVIRWNNGPTEPRDNDCTPRPRPPRPAGQPITLEFVEGRVYNERTGVALAGAYLQMMGTPYNAFADNAGHYRLGFDPDLVDECRSQYVRVIARGVPPQLIVLGRGPGGTDIYLRP